MSIKYTVGVPECGITGVHNHFETKILMMNKEDFDNWRECDDFKTAIENNGYSYSKELEDELINLMKNQGCISLVWHVFKIAS